MAILSREHRRWVVSVIAGACLILSMAGCGGDAGGSGGQTTIRYLGHQGEKGAMDKVIKAFEAAHPDVKVKADYVPSGPAYGQALMTQVQAGNTPDVFYGNGGTGATESFVPLAKAGRLLDLSDQPWVKDMPQQAASLYQVDGKTYGLLTTVSPHGLLYKTSTFESIGLQPPKTYSDLVGICQAASSKGKVGITLNAQSIGLVADMIAATTVYSADPDWNAKRSTGQVRFADSPGWQQALEMIKQLYQEKCFQPGGETANAAQSFQWVKDQRALMAMVPSSAMGSITGDDPTGWKMLPFPGQTEAQTTVAIGYQDGIAASATTKEKKAVLTFLAFVATPGPVTRAQLIGSASPDQFRNDQLPAALQDFAPFIADGHTESRAHDTWPGGSAYNAMNTAVVSAMIGQSSVVDALKTVDKAWGK